MSFIDFRYSVGEFTFFSLLLFLGVYVEGSLLVYFVFAAYILPLKSCGMLQGTCSYLLLF